MSKRWRFEQGPEGGVLVIRPKPFNPIRVLALLLLLGLALNLSHKLPKAWADPDKRQVWRLMVPLVAVGILAKKFEGWMWHGFGTERLEAGFSEVRYRHGIGAWSQTLVMPRNEFRGVFVLKEPPEYFAKNWARRWVAPHLGLAKLGDDYYQIGFGLSEAEADAFLEDLQHARGDWVYHAPR